MAKKVNPPQKLTKASAAKIKSIVNKHLKENNLSGYCLESFVLDIKDEKKVDTALKPHCPVGQRAVKVYEGGTWVWKCQ